MLRVVVGLLGFGLAGYGVWRARRAERNAQRVELVLSLVADGLTNAEIVEVFSMTSEADSDVTRILRKVDDALGQRQSESARRSAASADSDG